MDAPPKPPSQMSPPELANLITRQAFELNLYLSAAAKMGVHHNVDLVERGDYTEVVVSPKR